VALVHINFIGPWRVILGVKTVTVNIISIDEARDYIETHFGPVYQKKIESVGASRKQPIWDNSNILLNGTNIKALTAVTLKDGDKLDLIPNVAGG